MPEDANRVAQIDRSAVVVGIGRREAGGSGPAAEEVAQNEDCIRQVDTPLPVGIAAPKEDMRGRAETRHVGIACPRVVPLEGVRAQRQVGRVRIAPEHQVSGLAQRQVPDTVVAGATEMGGVA